MPLLAHSQGYPSLPASMPWALGLRLRRYRLMRSLERWRGKPLEMLLFMRDVRSRGYYEQMKGRGVRSLDAAALGRASGSAEGAKCRFVLIDAVGVEKSCKTDSRPLEKKPAVPLKDLLLPNRAPTVRSAEYAAPVASCGSTRGSPQTLRRTIISLILPMASAGFSPLGQTSVQFRIVRHRKRR